MTHVDSVVQQALAAKQAARKWALLSTEQKNAALRKIAQQLLENESTILAANEQDLAAAANNQYPQAYLDRLRLNHQRVLDLANSLEELAALPDPIGEEVAQWQRADGLSFRQIRVPLGVIGMIYEARPNVTIDAAAIALKTGNAIVLRGSRTARQTNQSLTASIQQALRSLDLPEEAVQYLTADQREAVDTLCTLNGLIDVIIPRGGADLINRVVKTSTVPVLVTGVGNCHLFVDQSADPDKAIPIVINAKTSRPAVCNAAEKLLLHKNWPYSERLLTELAAAGVQLRACPLTREQHPELAHLLQSATDADWDTEYLDLIIAVRTVADLDEALQHIEQHSTGHSEAIITEDTGKAARFLGAVDAAAVYHNASTRFTDGGEFGFGAEFGISTQKIHARGPMGLTALTSTKYLIVGNGHIR
ncbi:glutamate-5-semialdehyde dehydrogenase [Brevibacillus fulvus]|uniref:Gamma-glutamyl phosphate reductase n=1 Tax=Brevibacillus fulvus TaxID=1125967 RepID=A0A938XV55_9BACL|nr:glutamate-5-semialdehyde dehydrogenase [Brevibacillus fulvus]MBM7591053.1 glutamate-5-semialdehyde dehydrogenase [Brevibacillus fulvus]